MQTDGITEYDGYYSNPGRGVTENNSNPKQYDGVIEYHGNKGRWGDWVQKGTV